MSEIKLPKGTTLNDAMNIIKRNREVLELMKSFLRVKGNGKKKWDDLVALADRIPY